jgi:hypothetical protein
MIVFLLLQLKNLRKGNFFVLLTEIIDKKDKEEGNKGKSEEVIK